MPPELFDYQKLAIAQLKTGSALVGGVGSGKSITAISYYFDVECEKMSKPKDLFIITTAKKRDELDWEREAMLFSLSTDRTASIGGIKVTVDSWNNIKKYVKIVNAFFIFDEQRVVGAGSWVKSFYKITKNNNWLLLSATPGDTWMDYIPVFIANGFYRTRTEFIREHVVYNTFTKFPKIDRYVEETKLRRLRDQITVRMDYIRPTEIFRSNVMVFYDKEKFNLVYKDRWNPYTNKPIKDIGEYCHVLRKVVNSDPSRVASIIDLFWIHRKLIVFYNFNYELELLRVLNGYVGLGVAEYNGHKHEPLPTTEQWVYLVQYTSGSEGWNCIETNAVVFYSQNYSYRIMTQAAGRIDRLNTPFTKLYYYTLRSVSPIDQAIAKALVNKKNFNERKFLKGEFK